VAKAEKILEEMRAGRTSGWRFAQVRAALESRGFVLRPKAKGSHRIFKHNSGERLMVLDKGSGAVPPVYVERALAAIERVEKADE
jgi:predicted RNA binding protein YcfA (HicA-like mRNA interferase family)